MFKRNVGVEQDFIHFLKRNGKMSVDNHDIIKYEKNYKLGSIGLLEEKKC